MKSILIVFILTTLLFSCSNEPTLPKCKLAYIQKTHPVTTRITLEFLPKFNGYLEDVEQAQACSKETGRKILLFFTGYTTIACPGKIWEPLQDKKVREWINDNYILCVLFCDNQMKLDPPEYIYSDLWKDTIKTVGGRNLYLQGEKFHFNTQPSYILVDENLNQLHDVIGYMGNDYEQLIDALKKNRPPNTK